MSFQWIFDNAESISVDQSKVVGSTTTRDGTVRATSRGGQVWRFEVKVPDGPRWSDYRNNIAKAQALDRTTTANVQINNAGYNSWLTKYQGNCANPAAVTASWTQGGTTITLTGGQAASGYNFKAGDLLQLKSTGRVYQVAADCAYNSNTVTLNRTIIDASSSGTLVIGPSVTWNVICIEFPKWSIFARDQVSWAGPFVFVENLV